jgi:prepilin-type N-terminal cleavage/methylation domain-containing protein
MNRPFVFALSKKKAFTLVEVLMSIAAIGIITMVVFAFQTSSWKNSILSNRTIVASHMIERQIESMRMTIDRNPILNFPPVSGSITENGITLNWTISAAARPTDGLDLPNVRKCDLCAWWGNSKGDTLKVTTYLSKMF